MTQKDAALLETSNDPDELMEVADLFAASVSAADREVILRTLRSEDFLARLDSDDDYRNPPFELRVARIIKTLMDAPDSGAPVLVALTQSHAFLARQGRRHLLVLALVGVRPAPEAAVAFWRREAVPHGVLLHVTVDALAENGSAPAVALLGEILANPAHEPGYKVSWLHDTVLSHRDNPEMLAEAERLLHDGLPAELRPVLVESLFDYRRDEWYGCSHPVPPPWSAFSREARERLRRIGTEALETVNLDKVQQARVRTVLETLPE